MHLNSNAPKSIETERSKHKDDIRSLTDKLKDAEEALLSLNEFRENKEQIEAKVVDLETRLDNERSVHAEVQTVCF